MSKKRHKSIESCDRKYVKNSKCLNKFRKSLESRDTNKPEKCNEIDDKSRIRINFRHLLALVTVAIYGNSLKCGFVYDDRKAILENRNVIPFEQSTRADSWTNLLTDDFWGTPMHSNGSHKSYRPLISLTYKIQALILPTDAFWFHLVNLILHLTIVDQVFQLASKPQVAKYLFHHTSPIQQDTQAVSPKCSNSQSQHAKLGALLASILFAVHPIHVEAVTSIVGRAELLGTLCVLLSFGSLIEHSASGQSPNRKTSLLVKCFLFETLACFSKENCAIAGILINVIATIMIADVSNWFAQMLIHLAALMILLGTRIVIPIVSLLLAGQSSSQISEIRFWPKFSHLDNPLAQSEVEFCLRNQNQPETWGPNSKQTCSNEATLKQLGRSISMTRLYLPIASLKALVYPLELSYDWTLDSMGGLIVRPSDLRFQVTILCYTAFVSFMLMRLYKSRQRIKTTLNQLIAITLTNKCQTNCNKPSKCDHNHSDNSDAESDSGSVRSDDTTKTKDSGFIDSIHELDSAKLSAPKVKSKPTEDSAKSLDPFVWSLVWLLVPLLPSSNLIFSVGFLLAERTLYLPSVGMCLLVANLVCWLPSSSRLESLCDQLAAKKSRQFFRPVSAFCGFGYSNTNTNTSSGSGSLVGKVILIMPLIIIGSLKTVTRNEDWTSESSLFQSNLRQSRAKSLANLATLVSNLSGSLAIDAGPSLNSAENLYRESLMLEPNSADSLYNLALVLHDRSRRSSRQEKRAPDLAPQANHYPSRPASDESEVEKYYKLALEHRPNFALAALNLGAYQWETWGRFDEPMKLFLSCALDMSPRGARNHHQFIQSQLECLISGAKLCLEHRQQQQQQQQNKLSLETPRAKQTNPNGNRNPNDNENENTPSQRIKQQPQPQQQQQTSNSKADAYSLPSSSAKQPSTSGGLKLQSCETFGWTQWAQAKSKQIERFASFISAPQFGDLNRQMALIHWLQSQLTQSTNSEASSIEYDLRQASEFGAKSRVSIESKIYIGFVDRLWSQNESDAIEMLRKFIDIEHAKYLGSSGAAFEIANDDGNFQNDNGIQSGSDDSRTAAVELARLHQHLAKLLIQFRADKFELESELQIIKAIELTPTNFDVISESAYQAYQLKRLDMSAQLYAKALKLLVDRHKRIKIFAPRARDENDDDDDEDAMTKRKQLAKAHTNYGAILQVRGQTKQAKWHYKQAISFEGAHRDQRNSIAVANLARLQSLKDSNDDDDDDDDDKTYQN